MLHLSTRKKQMNSFSSLCNSDPPEATGKISIKTAYWDFTVDFLSHRGEFLMLLFQDFQSQHYNL